MDILDLLRADGSIVVNKQLAHKIGLNEAVVYSELVSLHKYWSGREMLTDGEWFFCTYENLQQNTTLPERTARRTINSLEKLGLIEKKTGGLPKKTYYRITKEIYTLFDDNSKVSNKTGQNGRTDNDGGSEAENKEEEGENPRHRQTGQNGRSSTAELAGLERTKWPGNNTRTNNTLTNNTKTSIQESDIEQTDLPTAIQKRLVKNRDRLNSDSITLNDIIQLWNTHKADTNPAQFAMILGRVLESTKGQIKSISKLMQSAFHNEETQKQTAKPQENKQGAPDIIPSWLDEHDREVREKHQRRRET